MSGLRIAYADPPYIGCAHLYRDHPDYAGEVDHVALVDRLQSEFDGWVLHAGAHNESEAVLAPLMAKIGARKCVWVKQFAAFKKNVPVAYAWEPVYIKAARKPVVSKRLVMRDWIMHPITMKKGLTGATPRPSLSAPAKSAVRSLKRTVLPWRNRAAALRSQPPSSILPQAASSPSSRYQHTLSGTLNSARVRRSPIMSAISSRA